MYGVVYSTYIREDIRADIRAEIRGNLDSRYCTARYVHIAHGENTFCNVYGVRHTRSSSMVGTPGGTGSNIYSNWVSFRTLGIESTTRTKGCLILGYWIDTYTYR